MDAMPVDFVVVDATVSVSLPMPMSVITSLNLAPEVIIDAKARNTFSSLTRKEILKYKGEHFKFVSARLSTKFDKTWQRRSGIPSLQNGIRLF